MDGANGLVITGASDRTERTGRATTALVQSMQANRTRSRRRTVPAPSARAVPQLTE